MQNLRNEADHRGREGKIKQDEPREGDKAPDTLNLRKLRFAGGEGAGREGVAGDGHWGGCVLRCAL